MKAGPMRHVVTLQARNEAKNAAGQPIKEWITLGEFRANVVTLSGREAIAARQIVATATHTVTMRHLGMSYPVTTQHRLLFGDRVLGIAFVNNIDNRNRQYDLTCEEFRE